MRSQLTPKQLRVRQILLMLGRHWKVFYFVPRCEQRKNERGQAPVVLQSHYFRRLGEQSLQTNGWLNPLNTKKLIAWSLCFSLIVKWKVFFLPPPRKSSVLIDLSLAMRLDVWDDSMCANMYVYCFHKYVYIRTYIYIYYLCINCVFITSSSSVFGRDTLLLRVDVMVLVLVAAFWQRYCSEPP